jgi:hypothetical protein
VRQNIAGNQWLSARRKTATFSGHVRFPLSNVCSWNRPTPERKPTPLAISPLALLLRHRLRRDQVLQPRLLLFRQMQQRRIGRIR